MTHLTPLGYLFYSRTKHSIWRHVITTSIITAIYLTSVSIMLDVSTAYELSAYSYFGLAAIAYLVAVRWLFFVKEKTGLARWLVMSLLGCTALATLFLWGIDSVSGMLTLSLSVILPGLLFHSRYIIPIAMLLVLTLALIHGVHESEIYTPGSLFIGSPTSSADILTYSTVLLALAFVTRLSVRRSEYTLERARQAEKRLRKQKKDLQAQLVQESAKLRANQLKEVQQLYSFAVLGQTTAATLHELSNHLTVLGMDLENLHGSNKYSKAALDAEESFRQVTAMVKTVRRRLDNYNPERSFRPYTIIAKTINDLHLSLQFTTTTVTKTTDPSFNKKTRLKGDPLAFSHIIAILLKNAHEACMNFSNGKIHITTTQTKSTIRVVISDNGVGISKELTGQLFSPINSTKPTGLGAGLFIAHHLAKTQFSGTLRLLPNNTKTTHLDGAAFCLEIPLSTKKSL